jgi:2-methylisocitrate lyase-like PEP mutase family enzyme
MIVEAIEREHGYAEAGADGIFAPGLTDIVLIAGLREASPLPLNIMIGDTSPSVRALAQHGVARVSHGLVLISLRRRPWRKGRGRRVPGRAGIETPPARIRFPTR